MTEVIVKPMKIPMGEQIRRTVIHRLLSFSLPKASAQTGVKMEIKT
jgi:hypothetical protein